MTSIEGPSRAERDALDAEAMRRIREGDEAAIGELYDRYSPVALGMALKIVREEGEAEDVVHDAFVAIVERADQFRPERGSVVAWLVTTVRNLALDRARRRIRRAQITDDELRHEPAEPIAESRALVVARGRAPPGPRGARLALAGAAARPSRSRSSRAWATRRSPSARTCPSAR